MNPRRHARDAAWEWSAAIARVFAPLLRDEELVDARREVFELLEPALFNLLSRFDRDRSRVEAAPRPSPTDPEETP